MIRLLISSFLVIGGAQSMSNVIPNLPSPTIPTFNVQAQTPNGHALPDPLYTGSMSQTFAPRKYTYENCDISRTRWKT